MSAFEINDYHLSVLAEYAAKHVDPYFLKGLNNAPEIGRCLHNENIRSLSHRYGASNFTESRYLHRPEAKDNFSKYSTVAIAKAASCFDYQCCENDDYYTTQAHIIMGQIRKHILDKSAGWEAAEWEMLAPSVRAAAAKKKAV